MATPLHALPVPMHDDGDVIPGSYIVRLHNDVDAAAAAALASTVAATRTWRITRDAQTHFVGFEVNFNSDEEEQDALTFLRFRRDVVAFVERNAIARTNARQDNVPSWGLGAIHMDDSRSDGYYVYPDHAGTGSRIYVIDTGIRCTHQDLAGRCRFGARFGSGGTGENSDGNGHGTHGAAIAAGRTYGVAKNATVVAVGVLSPAGTGSYADVISGIEFAANDCSDADDSCIGTLSLGGSPSQAVDDAANAFVAPRRFLAVSAGGSNSDAANYSPARAADVYTVMASDSDANRASFSNYGAVCSSFAPGVTITSAWHTSDTASSTLTGTSMAAMHVAGAGALAFASGRATGGRFDIENYINAASVTNTIAGVPPGTVNRHIHIDENF